MNFTRIALLIGAAGIPVGVALIRSGGGLGQIVLAISLVIIGLARPKKILLISCWVLAILYAGVFMLDRGEFYWLLPMFPMVMLGIASLLLLGSFVRSLFMPAPPNIE